LTPIYKIIVSGKAERDLFEIENYIFADSPQNAVAVVERIRSAIRSLDSFPTRFKKFEINKDPAKIVYSMSVAPFAVYYRVIEPSLTVEVIDIRRGARDHPPRFFR
jgi:plasmid stabilization system protein ParE